MMMMMTGTWKDDRREGFVATAGAPGGGYVNGDGGLFLLILVPVGCRGLLVLVLEVVLPVLCLVWS